MPLPWRIRGKRPVPGWGAPTPAVGMPGPRKVRNNHMKTGRRPKTRLLTAGR